MDITQEAIRYMAQTLGMQQDGVNWELSLPKGGRLCLQQDADDTEFGILSMEVDGDNVGSWRVDPSYHPL